MSVVYDTKHFEKNNHVVKLQTLNMNIMGDIDYFV